MGELEPPQPSAGDHIHAVVRSLFSAIPYAGGAAVELFTALITPPLERRRYEWMKEMGARLQDLEAKKTINITELGNDDSFVDTVLHASNIALRTSQEEKKKALLNAITNTALKLEPDQSLRQIFLNLIDSFTAWHIRILHLFKDPRDWEKDNNHKFPSWSSGGLSDVLENAFPELLGKRMIYDQLWQDLRNNGLVTTDSLHGMMTGGGLFQKRTSELGDRFMSFIKNPI